MAREEITENKQVNTQPGLNRNWIYGLGIAIVALLIFIAGMAVSNHERHPEFFGNMDKPVTERGFRIGGMMHSVGVAVTSNGETRTSGVVISVNGSGFTIAGSGSTTNVTTTSSTQYQGGNQVKQNDTVVVFGTTSNNTLNATQVVINP